MVATLISSRSVQLLAVAWVVAILLAYLLGADGLPFERPGLEGIPVIGQTVLFPLVFITIYLLILLGVTYLISRWREIKVSPGFGTYSRVLQIASHAA